MDITTLVLAKNYTDEKTDSISPESINSATKEYLEENGIDAGVVSYSDSAEYADGSVGAAFTDIKNDIVKISEDEPTSDSNRIWLSSATTQIEIPTKSEFEELDAAVSAITTADAADVGKPLKAKTITDGKVTEWELTAYSVNDIVQNIGDEIILDSGSSTVNIS